MTIPDTSVAGNPGDGAAAAALRGRRTALELGVLGGVLAFIYSVARPPLYERDGYVYHLLGRNFLTGTNPHHLLWNAVQALINRVDALLGIHSVIAFQVVGMAATVVTGVLLCHLLLDVTDRRALAFASALFVVLTPWTWFMAFQNQPYALMFLLFVVFLRCFVTPDGALPRGWRFAGAAAAAVGMVMLQQAAVLIVIGVAACFLFLGGWRRTIAWTGSTALPTALLYIAFSALRGVRNITGFWQWTTEYLRTQHSLQTRFPDSLVKSAMGVIGTFINQVPFNDVVADQWTPATILWFYGLVGAGMLITAAVIIARARQMSLPSVPALRPVVWVSVASILSWSVFCVFWEPTNYYWFILLAPFFVYVAAELRPSQRTARMLIGGLGLATAWNVHSNRYYVDAAGAIRAPEPQLAVIARNLRTHDLLWVVDLGWAGSVDYDLLSFVAAFDHLASIASVADVVGRSPNASAWQRAIEDTNQKTMQRGGRVFLSDRVFDSDTFERRWDASPFADYQVERPFPIDWKALGRELPAFIDRTYDLAPGGFTIGADSIWQLRPPDL
ncbi:MAG: hypothetical protein NVS4B3_10800 [Gemmatimonadaceae bacterium]